MEQLPIKQTRIGNGLLLLKLKRRSQFKFLNLFKIRYHLDVSNQ